MEIGACERQRLSDNGAVRSLPADHRYLSLSDEQLIEAAATGNTSAIAEFLRRNWPALRRMAESRVGSSGVPGFGVDDLMSTTARQVITAVSKGEFTAQGPNHARGYVITILRRAIARTFSADARDRRRLAHHGQMMTPQVDDALDLSDDDGLGEALLRHVRTLSELDLRTIVMRGGDLPFSVIAASLGCSEEAARQRWAQIRRKLRSVLGEYLDAVDRD
jgi:RNA polymerase sigma factor (sigma-70 family)